MKDVFIEISNQSEIEVNSLLLLGASSKRGDNSKIGFFGSGLKYAIAVLLKNKVKFHIFSGLKEIKITTSKENFRGNAFNVIKINGKKTSLTTDMGPEWEPWFAVREIYCNALDEGGHAISVTDTPNPEKGKTKFYIEFNQDLKQLFDNWDNYFSDKRKDIILSTPKGKFFSGSTNELIIYRKGVRCHSERIKSLFHYDLPWVEINESRVIKDTFNLKWNLPSVLGQYATFDMVKQIFDSYADTFEGGLMWEYCYRFNDEWLEAIGDRPIVIDQVAGFFEEEMAARECLVLPVKLAESLSNYFKKRINVLGRTDKYNEGLEVRPEQKHTDYINFALEFLNKGSIKITHPVKVFRFNNEHILGTARDGHIRLSEKVFTMGRRMVVSTILEEAAHLDSGLGDKTRGFQDYLFNQIINLIEEKIGERL